MAVTALINTQLTATKQHFVISCNEFHPNWTIHIEHTVKWKFIYSLKKTMNVTFPLKAFSNCTEHITVVCVMFQTHTWWLSLMQYPPVKSVLHRTLFSVMTTQSIAHDAAHSAVFPSQVHHTDSIAFQNTCMHHCFSTSLAR